MATQLLDVKPCSNSLPDLTLTRRQLKIARLLADPDLTQEQIAIMANTSRTTVKTVARKLREYEPGVDRELESYRRLLRKRVPDNRAVGAISEVMDAKQNPFARMRAVEYRDRILGLVAPAAEAVVTQPAPLFSLPNTTSITVNVIRKGD